MKNRKKELEKLLKRRQDLIRELDMIDSQIVGFRCDKLYKAKLVVDLQRKLEDVT